MRKGKVTPEVNTEPKLTIVVRTRTPLEAFQMLRAGQPVDVAAGYFANNGTLEEDFFMMDTIQKLHALAKYREMKAEAKIDMEQAQSAFDEWQKGEKENYRQSLLKELNKLNEDGSSIQKPGDSGDGRQKDPGTIPK